MHHPAFCKHTTYTKHITKCHRIGLELGHTLKITLFLTFILSSKHGGKEGLQVYLLLAADTVAVMSGVYLPKYI